VAYDFALHDFTACQLTHIVDSELSSAHNCTVDDFLDICHYWVYSVAVKVSFHTSLAGLSYHFLWWSEEMLEGLTACVNATCSLTTYSTSSGGQFRVQRLRLAV